MERLVFTKAVRQQQTKIVWFDVLDALEWDRQVEVIEDPAEWRIGWAVSSDHLLNENGGGYFLSPHRWFFICSPSIFEMDLRFNIASSTDIRYSKPFAWIQLVMTLRLDIGS
jgi:hypothetical protein